jgi:hypothetical protein
MSEPLSYQQHTRSAWNTAFTDRNVTPRDDSINTRCFAFRCDLLVFSSLESSPAVFARDLYTEAIAAAQITATCYVKLFLESRSLEFART